MKFDIWTFAFQIINFGVLLWILKRILYQPVREIMEQRRAQTVKKLEEAENARKEAEALQSKYQEDRKDMEAQQSRLLEEMKTEIAQKRQALLAEADREAQRHIDKGRALFEAEKERHATEIKDQALTTVELFAEKVLESIADRELHLAIIRKLQADLAPIVEALAYAAEGQKSLKAEVASAYPLSEDEVNALQQNLERRTGQQVILTTTTDKELLAGLRIVAEDQCFDASLRGQLATFVSKVSKDI